MFGRNYLGIVFFALTLLLPLDSPAGDDGDDGAAIYTIIPIPGDNGRTELYIVGNRLPHTGTVRVTLDGQPLKIVSGTRTLIVVELPDTIPNGHYRLEAYNSNRYVVIDASIARNRVARE